MAWDGCVLTLPKERSKKLFGGIAKQSPIKWTKQNLSALYLICNIPNRLFCYTPHTPHTHTQQKHWLPNSFIQAFETQKQSRVPGNAENPTEFILHLRMRREIILRWSTYNILIACTTYYLQLDMAYFFYVYKFTFVKYFKCDLLGSNLDKSRVILRQQQNWDVLHTL